MTNGDEIIILGNTCIKNYCENSGRQCELCGTSHRNRTHNFCKTCKIEQDEVKREQIRQHMKMKREQTKQEKIKQEKIRQEQKKK